jgi:hypothetical protein
MDSTTPTAAAVLPTLAQMHAFLRKRYKHERFEGRNSGAWCADYSTVVSRSSLESLMLHGVAHISRYESNTGEPVRYVAADVIADTGAL